MVDAANIVTTTSVYNTIAVNPVTGEVTSEYNQRVG